LALDIIRYRLLCNQKNNEQLFLILRAVAGMLFATYTELTNPIVSI